MFLQILQRHLAGQNVHLVLINGIAPVQVDIVAHADRAAILSPFLPRHAVRDAAQDFSSFVKHEHGGGFAASKTSRTRHALRWITIRPGVSAALLAERVEFSFFIRYAAAIIKRNQSARTVDRRWVEGNHPGGFRKLEKDVFCKASSQ